MPQLLAAPSQTMPTTEPDMVAMAFSMTPKGLSSARSQAIAAAAPMAAVTVAQKAESLGRKLWA